MLEIAHQVPGRLRLHLPLLRTDSRLAVSLPGQLRRYEGVRSVRANRASASVVIWHDPRRVSAGELQGHLMAMLQAAADVNASASASAATKGPPSTVSARGNRLSVSRRESQGGWLGLPTGERLGHWLRGIGRSVGRTKKNRDACSAEPARIRAAVERRNGLVALPGGWGLTPSSPGVAMLCRMNLRLSRWMLRQTVKCWWNGELGSVFGPDPSPSPQRLAGPRSLVRR
jgi:hypothetical protein